MRIADAGGPDWNAIDQVLGPAWCARRREDCKLLGFSEPHAWRQIPMLRLLSQYVALQQLALRMQRAKPLRSFRAAQEEAAAELGLTGDPIRQLKAWAARVRNGRRIPHSTADGDRP